MKYVLMKYSTILHDFFRRQVEPTPVTQDISEMQWPMEDKKIR